MEECDILKKVRNGNAVKIGYFNEEDGNGVEEYAGYVTDTDLWIVTISVEKEGKAEKLIFPRNNSIVKSVEVIAPAALREISPSDLEDSLVGKIVLIETNNRKEFFGYMHRLSNEVVLIGADSPYNPNNPQEYSPINISEIQRFAFYDEPNPEQSQQSLSARSPQNQAGQLELLL
jgi:hypothetical protein